MGVDFTSLDFETANSFRGSPCSVGLVKVRDGVVVAEAQTLIRPPEQFSHFDRFNSALHGITADMVADAPTWTKVRAWILDWVGGDVVVCHNAGFDISVIRYACAADQIPWPNMTFLCTLIAARRSFKLLSYRLPFVAEECGITLLHHHQATDDARAAAQIAAAMACMHGCEDLGGLAAALAMGLGWMKEGSYTGSLAGLTGGGGKLVRLDANIDADPDHAFFGIKVAFTGALMSMRRQDAWDAVSRLGGYPTQSISKKTGFLVCGDLNPAVLAPGMQTTGKAAEAAALLAKGHVVELLTEDDFVRAI